LVSRMRGQTRRHRIGGLLLATLGVLLAFAPGSARADACTPPVTNQVACENTKPGLSPGQWEIDGAGDPTIQGFGTAISVNKGETVRFKIKTPASSYRIDILRLGYYNGDGARRVATGLTPSASLPQSQPACLTKAPTGLIDCGNWAVSASWNVPSTAVSGLYIAHLIRNDTGGDSHIPFIVRDDASHSDAVVQTSDATWQAYNTYGGNSLYQCEVACPAGDPIGYKGAQEVSYNRPFHSAEDDAGGRSWLFHAEYPMIRFLEASGYDISYMSNADVHRRGPLLLNHKLFIASGHDEYWSKTMRDNVEGARDAGVNLAFFTGNEIFWKTRWAASIDGSSTQDRTLVSYKDTKYNAAMDPVEWTGTWRDPRFTTAKPENSLTGQFFSVNAGTTQITVPAKYKSLRLWRNTAVTSLTSGQSLTLAPSTLGYEWDVDPDNGSRPAGQFQLSSTTVDVPETFVDYGNVVAPGNATHTLTMYRAPSGARVFGAGTVQWAWGLDNYSQPPGTPVDRNMQQATVNLFADMGVQPEQMLTGLVRGTASTDNTAPTSTITSPSGGAVTDGTRVTVSGTAADTGGGVVAGVEVSTDGGTTWHPASGTTSWTYSWVAHGAPSARLKVRAVDDSGNLQTPGAGVQVGVTCPCSLFGNAVTPDVADAGDPSPIEVGVKFQTATYGSVSGIRFFKAAANTGTHRGSLWSATGERLASATFTNESASGWQSVTFDEPVTIQPDTTYVASYFAPNGHYAGTASYFYPAPSPAPNGVGGVDSSPLRAVRNAGGTANGVYIYDPQSTFPNRTFDASNYWVDVMFSPTPAPGTPSNVTAAVGGRTSATVSWDAPTTGGAAATYKVTPYLGSTPQTATTVNGSETSVRVTGLTTGSTYRFTVQATNPNGTGPESALSNAVTPLNPVAPSAPGDLVARPASQSARVDWAAPDSDGDSPITGYTVTPYIGTSAQTPVQVGASSTVTTITGLTDGQTYTFRVTATNAIGTSPASAASRAVTPQATIFDFTAPGVTDAGDGNPVELGVKFRADNNGTVTGVRFYKAAANTGTHTGSLWSASGTRLAQATFTGESATGWQAVTFATPVTVVAGATYVASYHAPNGHYSATGGAFAQAGVDNGPLHALPNTPNANGVYLYTGTGGFPSNTYNATDYGVDVLFATPKPGRPTGVTAEAAGRTSATVTWQPATDGGPASSYKVTAYTGSTAQTFKTVSGSTTSTTVAGLTTGTSYTFTVQGANASGSGLESTQSNAVTPLVAVVPAAPTNVAATAASSSARVTWDAPSGDGDSPITSYTVTPYVGTVAQDPVVVAAPAGAKTITGLTNGTPYTFRVRATNAVGTGPAGSIPDTSAVTPRPTIFDFSSPAIDDAGDGSAVELGVKFTSDFPGSITGIRFYKAAANSGTHTGSLWTAGGTLLARATFSNESATGWQTVEFSSPVAITPDTTYVASYHAPRGHYSATGSAFAPDGVDNPPLHALSNAVSGNGVYAYTAAPGFPTSTFNAGNYWVDVTFAGAPAPGTVTGVSATAGPASATVNWSAPTSGGPVRSYKITPYIGSTAQTAKTITGSPPATSTTVSGLTNGTAYTFSVQASNPTGSGPESARSSAVTPLSAAAPGAPTGVAAVADSTAANVSWTAPADDGGSAITGYEVTPFAGSTAGTPVQVGASARDATVTGLTNGTAYTFRVRAANTVATGAQSAASSAVTPRNSIFERATPAVVDAGDGGAVSLGVKFTAGQSGAVTGVRFYKAAANTGSHVGSLWSASGALLAQGTFTGESASGWQTLTFSTPVTIAADTIYVASYHAPNGHYSVTGSAFSPLGIDNGPLHAVPTSTSANGVYAYGSAPAFPTSSYNAGNYWVDLLFAPGT
jgi:N,N-dimethylformamidase beta subunit-like, C-terminal/Domain of unknown function (DUF4082)/Fibronectin type III domain